MRRRRTHREDTGSRADTQSLAQSATFDLLGHDLGRDVEAALQAALAGHAIFPGPADPVSLFRQALKDSIREIESDPRGDLFQRFLLKGPYEKEGPIPSDLQDERLSDDETAEAITFIFSHMVNCFKGAVSEMLAAAPCVQLLRRLQEQGSVNSAARLYVGDAVRVSRPKGTGTAKGADFHMLVERIGTSSPDSLLVAGVTEVKSYFRSEQRLQEQLAKHLRRAQTGLVVRSKTYRQEQIEVGSGKGGPAVQVAVMPSDWPLPRTFHFESSERGRSLHADPGVPLGKDDITEMSSNRWRITLRWSKEALAAAAYEMTFWYMEKVGEIIYSAGVPKAWSEMTPVRAGQNVAKAMLYYAILRCHTARQEQRAIALYNTYGFGYALGMNFRNAQGRREMLWPQDLDEILVSGKTKLGVVTV